MKTWIRGVNLGGWLVLERFITPYLFALTSCHLAGDFCYYPGQLGVPPLDDYRLCDTKECKPILLENPVTNKLDYPWDEYTLIQQFHETPFIAREYLRRHYDSFVTRNDIHSLSKAGVTHVRIPMPHWIRLSDEQASPYLQDEAWMYFLRVVDWCREYGIQVWADLHTAPGSQNGFDNSGKLKEHATCEGWNSNETLTALQNILVAIHNDGIRDTVSGIGILNEPYMDCDMAEIKDYNRKALQLVRTTLGNMTDVIIGDMFNATLWDNGYWENEPHTYLDSHYYHVFAENTRALSPKQHIALTCQKNARDVNDCCHDANGKKPTSGISRLVSEWSAAYDTLPVELLHQVMDGIRETGQAPFLERNLTESQQEFLKQFVKAQMVVYESNSTGVSSGWFYWNFKMEGGAFAEWDFLRGVREKWIPTIPAPNVTSVSKFGTCQAILKETENDKSIVHEYPDPKHSTTWKGTPLDDDLVISMGKDEVEKRNDDFVPSKEKPESTTTKDGTGSADDDDDRVPAAESPSDDDAADTSTSGKSKTRKEKKKGHGFLTLIVFGSIAYAVKRVFFSGDEHRRGLGYSSVHGSSSGEAVMMAV